MAAITSVIAPSISHTQATSHQGAWSHFPEQVIISVKKQGVNHISFMQTSIPGVERFIHNTIMHLGNQTLYNTHLASDTLLSSLMEYQAIHSSLTSSFMYIRKGLVGINKQHSCLAWPVRPTAAGEGLLTQDNS